MNSAYPVLTRPRKKGGPDGGESHPVIGEYSLSRRPLGASHPTDTRDAVSPSGPGSTHGKDLPGLGDPNTLKL